MTAADMGWCSGRCGGGGLEVRQEVDSEVQGLKSARGAKFQLLSAVLVHHPAFKNGRGVKNIKSDEWLRIKTQGLEEEGEEGSISFLDESM